MMYEVGDTLCIFLVGETSVSQETCGIDALHISETNYKVTYAKVKISREPNSVGFIKLVSSSC